MDILNSDTAHLIYLVIGILVGMSSLIGMAWKKIKNSISSYLIILLDAQIANSLKTTATSLTSLEKQHFEIQKETAIIKQKQDALEKYLDKTSQDANDISKKIDNIYNILIEFNNR